LKLHLLCLFLLFCFAKPISAQNPIPTDSLLNGEKLIADLDSLKKTILETHVSPFTYCSEESFNQAFEEARSNVVKGMLYYDYLALVGKTLQVLRDSHTSLFYPALAQVHKENGGLFVNMQLFSVEGRSVYVKEDRTGILPQGVQLLRINEVNIDSLYQRNADFSLYEGDSENSFFAFNDALFPPMIGVWTNLKRENTFEYQIPGSSDTLRAVYPGKTYKEWREFNKKRKVKTETYTLDFRQESKTAVLHISSFSHPKSKKYYRFLRQSFRKIRKAEVDHLILDLRGNTGGKSNRMEALLRYVSDDSLRIPNNIIAKSSAVSQKMHAKSFKGLHKYFLTHFNKKNEEVQNWLKIVSLESGSTDTVYYRDYGQEIKKPYQGKCSLLIDGQSASATVNFAAGFRFLKRGVIYGSPCLGPYTGTWGNPAPYQLPNTKIKLSISTIRFNTTSTFDFERNNLVPDVLLKPNPRAWLEGIDNILELVVKQ